MRRALLKGEWQWSTIAALILVAIVGIIWLIFVWIAGDIAAESQTQSACEASVYANTVSSVINPKNIGELSCTTEHKTVAATTADGQKRAIADAMTSCWQMFGKGQLRLFAPESGTYCVVCSRLVFATPQKIGGFSSFLKSTQAPGKSVSYLEFLTNDQVTQDYDDAQIDTSAPQAVMFIYTKNVNDWMGRIVAPGALVAGGVLSLATGGSFGIVMAIVGGSAAVISAPYLATQDYAGMMMVYPYDHIKDLGCTAIEGKAGPLGYY